MMNQTNRPSIVIQLGAISASAVEPVLLAQKKMKVKSAKFVQDGAISASGANYLAFDLKVNDVLRGQAVDTQLGLAKGAGLELLAEDLVLEKGDYVSLNIAETGAFAQGASALLVLDVEIIGN